MDAAAWITIGLNVLMAAVYYAVGRVVGRREVSEDAELAKKSFSGWWHALAAVTASGAVATAIGSQELWGLSAFVAYLQTVLFIIIAAIGALLYYFVYLFTGKRGTWKPIAIAYALYFIAFLYYLAAADPIGLKLADTGGQELEYANDLSDTAFAQVMGVLLLLPVILGAIGYVSLIRKVPDRSGHFRIGSVAGAFILWFGSSFLAGQILDVAQESWWQPVGTAIALGASALVYVAFAPPAWLAKRLHIEGYGSPGAGDGSK